MNILNTGVKYVKNVGGYVISSNSFKTINKVIIEKLSQINPNGKVLVFVDIALKNHPIINDLKNIYKVVIINSIDEPTTSSVNSLMKKLKKVFLKNPSIIVGIGGGTTLDTAKACSNLFTNKGLAEDYQGWDLVKKPGVYKIAVPTISGTGAEASRTCVLTNKFNGLKLGMNSDYTIYDYIIMDPEILTSVPNDQYFYTGMDAYIHCMESIEGMYRNPVGDAFSKITLELCRDVFLSNDMKSLKNREKLMVASYLGGCSIASSYVGVIHPLSAALSVVLGYHHCIANCIVMNSAGEFYPTYYKEFKLMLKKQKIKIPSGICSKLDKKDFDNLYDASIMHEKPLFNALGKDFKNILNYNKVKSLFKKM